MAKLCYNLLTNEWEKCKEGSNKGRGMTIPLNRLCNANCPLSQTEFIEMVNLLNTGLDDIYPVTLPFITPTVSDIILGWPFIFAPSITFVGNELYWEGTPTGWVLVNVTNQGVEWGLGDNPYFQIEFESTVGCLNFLTASEGEVVDLGAGPVFRVYGGGIFFGDPGRVSSDSELLSIRGCVPSDINCGGDPPTLAISSPVQFTGTIPVGLSTVDLGAPLFTVVDQCCYFKGLSTDVGLLEATLSNDYRYLTFNNLGTEFSGTVTFGLWTSCGYEPDFFAVEFPPCDAELTFVNDHYTLVIPDSTGLIFLRATDAYTFTDPSNCCTGPIEASVDNPDIDVTFDEGTGFYTFTYTGSDYGSMWTGELTFTTACAQIYTAPLTVVLLDTGCAGAINDDVTDLNTEFNSGNPFTVPLSGSTVINVTTNLFSFTDVCCGTEAAILNVELGMYNTPGLTVSPILNDGTMDITLTSDGTVVAGVQSVQLAVVSPCGSFLMDLDYEIV